MNIVAFDPGTSGAWAWGYGPRLTPFVDDLPVAGVRASKQINAPLLAEELRALISMHGMPVVAIIEDVHVMPKQGIASSGKFMQAKGTLVGICAGLKIPLAFVSPAVWKRQMGLSSDKEMCRLRAIERWPGLALRLKRKGDHDRAEAALITEWWYRFRAETSAKKNLLETL